MEVSRKAGRAAVCGEHPLGCKVLAQGEGEGQGNHPDQGTLHGPGTGATISAGLTGRTGGEGSGSGWRTLALMRPVVRVGVVCLALLAAALAASCERAAGEESGGGVPTERLILLARGVNIPHWWWLAEAATPEYRARYFSVEEARQLKQLALTHVRLPVDPQLVYDHVTGRVRAEAADELKRHVRMLHARGLAE